MPEPYQERVLAEKRELDDKLSRLESFLTPEEDTRLDEEERTRLTTQLDLMRQYSTVLGERITAWGI